VTKPDATDFAVIISLALLGGGLLLQPIPQGNEVLLGTIVGVFGGYIAKTAKDARQKPEQPFHERPNPALDIPIPPER